MKKNGQEDFLTQRLQAQKEKGLYRSLPGQNQGVDFSSNDYLGLAHSRELSQKIKELEKNLLGDEPGHGSGGSRLLSGNHPLFESTEAQIAAFHGAESALIFNSGYGANTGLVASVCGRHDIILYDEYVHASLRDAITLSRAKNFSFAHNDLNDLEKKIEVVRKKSERLFIVVESLYSMDGDSPDLERLVQIGRACRALLIVDEAHATGVYGPRGEGKVFEASLQEQVFARIHTFGKALGVHSAAVVGSKRLKEYLVNFARSFIYTTAMPPSGVVAIRAAYEMLPEMQKERKKLQENIHLFQELAGQTGENNFSAIRTVVVAGNEQARRVSNFLIENGFDVRALLSPTVPEGKERLRICLQAGHSAGQIEALVQKIKEALS